MRKCLAAWRLGSSARLGCAAELLNRDKWLISYCNLRQMANMTSFFAWIRSTLRTRPQLLRVFIDSRKTEFIFCLYMQQMASMDFQNAYIFNVFKRFSRGNSSFACIFNRLLTFSRFLTPINHRLIDIYNKTPILWESENHEQVKNVLKITATINVWGPIFVGECIFCMGFITWNREHTFRGKKQTP